LFLFFEKGCAGLVCAYEKSGIGEVEVYFDDFKVEHTKSPVIQTDEYYPFGLTFNSYRRENSVVNRIKFQGQEHIDELNLGWDSFKWRNHQPDIGRFFNVDPLAEKYVYNSPYAFSENKVVAHRELEGLEAEPIIEELIVILEGSAPALEAGAAAATAAVIVFKDELVEFGGEVFDAMGTGNPEALRNPAAGSYGRWQAQSNSEAPKPVATEPYKRPNNATTPEQRKSVQDKPCTTCGKPDGKKIADHKKPLVKEHYETGKIDKKKMRDPDSVQPQCEKCSQQQGAEMSKYSKEQKKLLEERKKQEQQQQQQQQ
jgi:RHS repeat-associated protein